MKKISDALRQVADDLDKITDKKKLKKAATDIEDETVILNSFKRMGIPYTVAKRMFDRHGAGYLARKIFLLEYRIIQNGARVENKIAWIQRAIEEDYEEPDVFISWLKSMRESVHLRKDVPYFYIRLVNLTG